MALAHTGKRRRAEGDPRHRRRQVGRSRGHERRVEGPGHLERHHPAHPVLPGVGLRPGQVGHPPGQHHLARGVDVGHPEAPPSARRARGQRLGSLQFRSQQGRHARRCRGGRRRHGPAPRRHQAQPRPRSDRPRPPPGRCTPPASARRPRPAAGRSRAASASHEGEADREEGRLGVLGAGQCPPRGPRGTGAPGPSPGLPGRRRRPGPGRAAKTSAPMPTAWLPWPGKSRA